MPRALVSTPSDGGPFFTLLQPPPHLTHHLCSPCLRSVPWLLHPVFYFHWSLSFFFSLFPTSRISHHFLLWSSPVIIAIHPGVQARILEPRSIPPFPWPLNSGIPPFISTFTDISQHQANCMTVIALTYPPKWPKTQQPEWAFKM